MVGIALVDGVHHLVGLLDDVLPQRRVGLLAIPWTAARRAEHLHHLLEALHVKALQLRKVIDRRSQRAGAMVVPLQPIRLKSGVRASPPPIHTSASLVVRIDLH